MSSRLCFSTLNGYITLVHFDATFMLTFCVLNLTFSVVSAVGNLLVIRALWKASSIPTTLKNLFLSLAVSDLAVGLIPQLMLGVNIAVILQREAIDTSIFDDFCPKILTAYLFFLFFLASVSFLTVTAIAVDRFLAISLHLRYQEIVTFKRVVITLLGLWLTSAFGALIFITIPEHNLTMVVIVEIYGLCVASLVYIRIYRVVRHHQNQILTQCQLHNDHAMEVLRQKKSTINALFVYLVFIACYVPNLCSAILMLVDVSRISFVAINQATVFPVLLNSSLNPLLYCWRYREVRQIVKSTVKRALRISDSG